MLNSKQKSSDFKSATEFPSPINESGRIGNLSDEKDEELTLTSDKYPDPIMEVEEVTEDGELCLEMESRKEINISPEVLAEFSAEKPVERKNSVMMERHGNKYK